MEQGKKNDLFLKLGMCIVSVGSPDNVHKMSYHEEYAHFNMVKNADTYHKWLELEKNFFMNRFHRNPRTQPVPYTIVDFLGAGAFGEVWLVTNDDGKRYALKAVHKSKWAPPQAPILRYILGEKRNLASVHHPIIQGLIDRAVGFECLCFVLPLIEGGDLTSLFQEKSKAFPLNMVKFYSAQVLLGLEYMHKVGMVYRDLKPENIGLLRSGFVQILDLGLAKVLDTELQRTSTVLGTPGYIGPEVFQNSVGYSFGVDWWAFGVLIYELLVGDLPFHVNDNEACVQLEMVKGANSLSDVVINWPSHVNKDARDLISGLCRKNPSYRYGCQKNRAEQIKDHPFFKDTDFVALFNKRAEVPRLPPAKNAKKAVQPPPNQRKTFANF